MVRVNIDRLFLGVVLLSTGLLVVHALFVFATLPSSVREPSEAGRRPVSANLQPDEGGRALVLEAHAAMGLPERRARG